MIRRNEEIEAIKNIETLSIQTYLSGKMDAIEE